MCNDKGTKRFRTVIVDCDTKLEYTLQSDDILNKAKRIVAIEAYKVGDVSKSSTGRAVVNDTIFSKSYLTISSVETDEVLNKVPFTDLNKKTNNGMLFLVDIPPVAMSKCKIVIPDNAALSAAESWVLGFHYE